MHETPDDLAVLDDLLERSYGSAGHHLRAIITPDRLLDAAEVTRRLTGMRLLALATVTADGRPLVSPVDGLFFRGRFWFGSGPTSIRLRHIAHRPAVSVTHTSDQRLVVTVHGTATVVPAGERAGFDAYATEVYGSGWQEWGAPAPYARIDPDRMYAATFGDLTDG
ncbi:MAG: pyridoxamine 5'-phosphate oxidase family protein [Acidimicrobiia bacterium]|nr:pyridoxamine 5'-phosphate oxidase family protein [Acidimicrobiia bacterium]